MAIINKVGYELTELKYDEVYGFYEGLTAVKKEDKWGFINIDGTEVIHLTV